MNSPTLPPVMSPKLSAAMTFFTLRAARCSMMALALPSRSEETTNSISLIGPADVPGAVGEAAAAGREPVATSSKSRVAMVPGETLTRAVAES